MMSLTDGEYADHMFKNDVSKDEYTGHMYALGVVAELVVLDGPVQ